MSTPTEDEQPTTTYEQAREELADVVRRLEAVAGAVRPYSG